MRKALALVAVFALALTAFVAVGLALLEQSSDTPRAEPTPSPTTPPPPSVTRAPDAGLTEAYAQRIDWQPCEADEDQDCGFLTVPVDYSEPEGETIDLALLRVPASGARVGSLVVNPGGPGAPGTSYASLSRQVFREPLLQGYDIVGFDPRGTGRSAPVDCLSDAELDDYLATDPSPDTPAEVEDYESGVLSFGEKCVVNSGPVVGHVTTIEAARDMDVLRSALGEEQLAYFGASYGTKLGATYAELFPDKVGRFVLDGAVDVSISSEQLGLEQAAGFETALRAYVQNCLDSTDNCFLGDSVDEGLATIRGLLDDIDEQPLPAGDRELTVGNAFYGIITPLYNRDYWFLLSTALASALDGKGSALMNLADAYASRNPDGSYADNSVEANYAINCLDDPGSASFDEVPSTYADYEEASPTFGRVFAWSATGCRGIDVTSSEAPLTIEGAGAAPILVLGTTRDPATPFEWAEALAAQLDSGVLVERDGDGHTAYNAGNACIDEVVEDYLLAGDVPADGTSC
ncbi:pimeloyl-ACP methyl ester carboxylesterase [Nocardioides cavernae]|uniref:Pimeloyl-ACP methyl ester carboxylesterase n=1 Tax=Nocardioides cavernae TaxID=1921566 RepID=A0A7Y9H2H0_9ACTN|nr:alpha/beta hydrolase [Nocardioides cavernae]NYE36737.1 pimeloyl-ACP methyl ester carboxylesterase [Nocardioides cavernae]